MHLSPKEIEKLMLHNAGALAQKRYSRGLRLNYVEAIALIAAQALEFIRDGNSVADLMEKGKRILGIAEVMPGVSEMIHEVQIEGTFKDGTKLLTIHQPVCSEWGEEKLALYSSGLTRITKPESDIKEAMLVPGKMTAGEGIIKLNIGRNTKIITVLNTGDRPVQVGSHYPFFEVNPLLEFDRNAAYGMRLNLPSGTAVRFEPGESKDVELVELAGEKIEIGANALVDGKLETNKEAAISKMVELGFKTKREGV